MSEASNGIKVKTSSFAEVRNLIGILTCSGIERPNFTFSQQGAASCKADAEEAVRNGWAKNLGVANLALWQVPPITIKGEDAALDLTQRITDVALESSTVTSVLRLCARGPQDCNKDPITREEKLYVTGSTTGARLTPEMNTSRALQITPAHAALNGLFDAVMSPDNFRTKKDGVELTVEKTLADIRSKNSKTKNEEEFEKCLTNVGNPKQCAKEGVRKGLGMVVDEGVNYNGSQFLGIKKGINVAR